MFVGAFGSLLEPINSRPSPPPTSGVLAPTRPPLCVDTSSLASLTRWLAFVAGACFRCGPPRVACAASRSIRWTSPRIYPLDLSVGSFLDMSVGFVRWIFPLTCGSPRSVSRTRCLLASRRLPGLRLCLPQGGGGGGPYPPPLPPPCPPPGGPDLALPRIPPPPCATGERDGGGRQLRAP